MRLNRMMAAGRLAVMLVACQAWMGAQTAPAEAKPGETKPAEAPKPAAKTEAPADPNDEGFSFGVFYWYAPAYPHMRTGHAALSTDFPANLDYPQQTKPAPGVMISIPAGKYNSFRISAFESRAPWASTKPATDLALFGSSYYKNERLDVKYRLRSFKATWDYMTWPFPIEGSTFRLKTLWSVQYTTIRTSFNGPQTVVSGTVNQTSSEGTNSFVYPTFGVGVEKFLTPSKNLRWEANASGFAFPKRAVTWDGDTFVAYKIGKLEIDVGAKAFHFKTSPKRTEDIFLTMFGGYAGVRWYL